MSSKVTAALLWAWAPLTCFALWAVYRDPSFVISMAVSPDGSRVAVSRLRGTSTDLEVWSTGKTPAVIHRRPREGGLQVGFLDNSRILIQRFSLEKLFEPVVVRDLNSWKQLWQFPVSDFPCKVECGGGRFAIDVGGTMRVFDGANYQEILDSPSNDAMRLSPNGEVLATRNAEGWRCLSVATGTELLTVPEQTEGACFSADGKKFICGLWGGGLAAFDLSLDFSDSRPKSKELTGAFRAERLSSNEDGIVFLDRSDDYLKIWEGNPYLARTLFPRPFPDANLAPVTNSQVWISQPGRPLCSLDLSTGTLKPLQWMLRGYATGLWLLWCVAWIATRMREANFGLGGGPMSLKHRGGPALDLCLTVVPVIAYFSLMRNEGIWLTGWDTEIALGGAATISSVSMLWLVLGQRSVSSRLFWASAGFGALIGVAQAHGIRLMELRGVIVGMFAAALTWWVYRICAAWRFGPVHEVTEARRTSKRLRWSIRHLLIITAISAMVVQLALHVDFKQLISVDLMDISEESKAGFIIYLHAIIPLLVCFAPWSFIKRLTLLFLLLGIYWGVWDLEGVRRLAIHLGWSSCVVCGILWLHDYRIIREPKPGFTE